MKPQEIIDKWNIESVYTNRAIYFMRDNGYYTIEDMLNDNKKIMWKMETSKTDDGYKITATPYFEDII